MVRKPIIETTECIAGGKGPAIFHKVITDEEFGKAGCFYAKVILPPGSTVGYHQHVGDCEPYYVVAGHGIFVDADGARVPIGPGDVCKINDKEYHGIENTSETEDLEFMALIYNRL